MGVAGAAFWRLPGRFGIARMLGRKYSLRSVVFHHIAAKPSPFTEGIQVSTSPRSFEDALKFLTAHYVPVSLEEVLTDCGGRGLPDRAVLVTFDDAYASVAEIAGPLCRQYRVPAVFFVNAAFVDNRRLAPDNLICYVAKTSGMAAINAAAQVLDGQAGRRFENLAEVFGDFLPSITIPEREVFLDAMRRKSGVDERSLAQRANLYISTDQLRDLAGLNFEIGNHTYTHTHCRLFKDPDFVAEIDRNKAELEAISGTKVRSFSQPYGSSRDVTRDLVEHLIRTGHQAAFLSESVANSQTTDHYHLDRIGCFVEADSRLFLELEVLPRLRTIRNALFPNSASARVHPVETPSDREERVELNEYVKS